MRLLISGSWVRAPRWAIEQQMHMTVMGLVASLDKTPSGLRFETK